MNSLTQQARVETSAAPGTVAVAEAQAIVSRRQEGAGGSEAAAGGESSGQWNKTAHLKP